MVSDLGGFCKPRLEAKNTRKMCKKYQKCSQTGLNSPLRGFFFAFLTLYDPLSARRPLLWKIFRKNILFKEIVLQKIGLGGSERETARGVKGGGGAVEGLCKI